MYTGTLYPTATFDVIFWCRLGVNVFSPRLQRFQISKPATHQPMAERRLRQKFTDKKMLVSKATESNWDFGMEN